MNIGTRSVLYGHIVQFFIPGSSPSPGVDFMGSLDVRLWASFWLHDIGYFQKRDMDGVDGKHTWTRRQNHALLFGDSWGAFTAAIRAIGQSGTDGKSPPLRG